MGARPAPVTLSARERYADWRRWQPHAPRLTRRDVQARGLTFAVYSSPAVENTVPLLCINGGMLYSHTLLWPALAPLAARRQLILYDQRGRGATSTPPARHMSRIEYDAGDVAALRNALGIARWDLLGHSWGGGIAMLAAARDALGVRRLVLVDAVGPTSDWIASLHRDALARLDGAQRERLAALDPLALHVADAAIHSEYSRALYPAYFADRDLAQLFAPPRDASDTGAAVAARLRREGYNWRDAVREIRATTLLVHGAQDLIPLRLARENAILIPSATLVQIDAAGHMPFWEQPEQFFGDVGAFLAHADRGS